MGSQRVWFLDGETESVVLDGEPECVVLDGEPESVVLGSMYHNVPPALILST